MSTTPSELNRRSVLRRAAAIGVLATPAAGLLAACATSSSDNNSDGEKAGTKTDEGTAGGNAIFYNGVRNTEHWDPQRTYIGRDIADQQRLFTRTLVQVPATEIWSVSN